MATYESWSPDQASIRQLVARLVVDARDLVADLSALLGAEARERAAELRQGSFLLAGALGALLAGLAVVSGAAVAALALAIPVWSAALVVGVVELGLALVLARLGVARLRRFASPPDKTLSAVERGMRALRAEAEAAGRPKPVSEGAYPPPRGIGQPPA